ncbi:hypothetical protein [Natronococcus roseus]|uniref:hypothetical protein n=1 Tax=Natronococcus roseus TaxID=1052014 RepID=UPI00374C8FC0
MDEQIATLNTDSESLDLRRQRFLYAIIKNTEEDDEGRYTADTTQINAYVNAPKSSLHDMFDDLDSRGLIEVGQRSREEMETNRIPPKTATITDEGLRQIREDGLIKQAMAEDPTAVSDPSEQEAIRERLTMINSKMERLHADYREDLLETAEEIEETAKEYYRENVAHSKEAKERAENAEDAVEAMKREVVHIDRFDGLVDAHEALADAHEDHAEDFHRYARKTTPRVKELEADVERKNHELRAVRMALVEAVDHIQHLEETLGEEWNGSRRIGRSPTYKPREWEAIESIIPLSGDDTSST